MFLVFGLISRFSAHIPLQPDWGVCQTCVSSSASDRKHLKKYPCNNVSNGKITLHFFSSLIIVVILVVFSNFTFTPGVWLLSPDGPLHISTKVHVNTFVFWQSPPVFFALLSYSQASSQMICQAWFICFSEQQKKLLKHNRMHVGCFSLYKHRLWWTNAAPCINLAQWRDWEKWEMGKTTPNQKATVVAKIKIPIQPLILSFSTAKSDLEKDSTKSSE